MKQSSKLVRSFSSLLNNNKYSRRVSGYFKYHWNISRVFAQSKDITFKIDGKKYKNYQDWKQQHTNEEYDTYKLRIMHATGVGSFVYTFMSLSLDENNDEHPITDIMKSFCMGAGGYIVGYSNHITIPAIGAIGILGGFHQYCKNRNKKIKQAKRDEERRVEKQRIEQWRTQQKKKWEVEFNKYFHEEVSNQRKPKYWSSEEYIKMKISKNKGSWEYGRHLVAPYDDW